MARADLKDNTQYQDLVSFFKEKGFQGHPRFYELLAAMALTHAAKNHDYAGSRGALANLKACKERYGISPIVGVAVRLTDKDGRFETWFENYVRQGDDVLQVKDESIHDTLLDRAVYSLLLSILIDEEAQEAAAVKRPVRFRRVE